MLSIHTSPIIDLSLLINRSSSPSSPNNGGRESQLPQLLKVNQNFSLGRRPVSIAETNANSVRLERQRLQLENDQQLEDEIVLRERYFQYWAQQQVGNFSISIINVLKSATPKIGSEGGVPLLFIKRSDEGVALIFLRRAKMSGTLLSLFFFCNFLLF